MTYSGVHLPRYPVFIISLLTMTTFVYYITLPYTTRVPSWRNYDKYNKRKLIIEQELKDALKYDKGMGCKMPVLDPFSKEVTQYARNTVSIICKGEDWVKCHYTECQVVKEILKKILHVICTYRDLLYVSDSKYVYGAPVTVYDTQRYVLKNSDHVQIQCSGLQADTLIPVNWTGISLGFRKHVDTIHPPPENKDSIDVLIFGFDSLSKYGLIREMPKTVRYITEELKMTILEGYNIVGDGTSSALFPILSGQTEFEIPDARRKISKNTIDVKNFLFDQAKKHGYRTAYFEDMPSLGSFQWRFNGFNKQPADHYLRPFFKEDYTTSYQKYCVGDTPRHHIMMNITEQFLNLPNIKRFIFTFIADVSHNNFNMISKADEATVDFFKSFKENGRTKNTLLIFMGDHGCRYAPVRKTFQGHLEERLPLMAFLLPDDLLKIRPAAQEILESNSQVLTTPHDIHATILDAMDLPQYIPDYKIPGADIPRAMSLLKPIPKNRSCSEAGIEPHWCACVTWTTILPENSMYFRAARALLDYINRLTKPVRSQCALRTLTIVSWVRKQQLKNKKVMKTIKLTVGPGTGMFEGTVTYLTRSDTFSVQSRDISRVNMYNQEPDCIQPTHPHLNMFCYCKSHL